MNASDGINGDGPDQSQVSGPDFVDQGGNVGEALQPARPIDTPSASGISTGPLPTAFNVSPAVNEFDGLGTDAIGDCVQDCCYCVNDASNFVMQQIANQLQAINASITQAAQSISASLSSAVAVATANVTPAQYHVDDELTQRLALAEYMIGQAESFLQQQQQQQGQSQSVIVSNEFVPPINTVEPGAFINVAEASSKASGFGGGQSLGSSGGSSVPPGQGSVGGSNGASGGSVLAGGGGVGSSTGSNGGNGVVVGVPGNGNGSANQTGQTGGEFGNAVITIRAGDGEPGKSGNPGAGGVASANLVVGQTANQGTGKQPVSRPFPVDITEPLAFLFSGDDDSWEQSAVEWYAPEINKMRQSESYAAYLKAKMASYGPIRKRSESEGND